MEETEAAPLRAYLAISPASMLSGRTRAMEGGRALGRRSEHLKRLGSFPWSPPLRFPCFWKLSRGGTKEKKSASAQPHTELEKGRTTLLPAGLLLRSGEGEPEGE